MKRFLIAAAALAFAAWTLPTTANEKRSPLRGDAPPSKKATKPKKKVAKDGLFDVSELGRRDKASDAAAESVVKGCRADPESREGATPAQEKRCNAAVAKLVARGDKAVPSIFTALNGIDRPSQYYAAHRLLGTLARTDDERIRKLLVDGYGALATKRFEDSQFIAWAMPWNLDKMMGAGPGVRVPWEHHAVTDSEEEIRRESARWKAFVAANEGKTRKEIVAEHLAKARKEKADDNAKKAYRAISFLIEHDPREASKAARAYSKRRGLKGDVQVAFENLEAQANFAVEEQQGRKPVRPKGP